MRHAVRQHPQALLQEHHVGCVLCYVAARVNGDACTLSGGEQEVVVSWERALLAVGLRCAAVAAPHVQRKQRR